MTRLVRSRLRVEALEERCLMSAEVINPQTFENVQIAQIPDDWFSWNTSPNSNFGVSSQRAIGGANSLLSSGANANQSRAWWSTVVPADFGVQATYFADFTGRVQLFARGSNLNNSRASYYAITLSAGQVELTRVQQGHEARLSTVRFAMPSSQWLRASLLPKGDQLAVEIVRNDTEEYLNSAGQWQTAAAYAIQLNDGAIRNDGLVGVARPQGSNGNVWLDNFGVVTGVPAEGSVSLPPVRPTPQDTVTVRSTTIRQNFDTTGAGAIPTGWAKWSSATAPNRFGVSETRSLSGRGLTSQGVSNTTSRSWYDTEVSSEVQVSASIYLDTLIPAHVFARGRNLNSANANFYAVSVTRDMTVELVKTVNGQSTVLASLRSNSYLSDRWVRVTLSTIGNRISAQVQRLDSGLYLNSGGDWQTAATNALETLDGTLTDAGFVGLARQARYFGTVVFDDFEAMPIVRDTTPPQVTVTLPSSTTPLSGTSRISATATDASGIVRVEFLLDGLIQKTQTTEPYFWEFNTTTVSNGTHLLTVRAIDGAGNLGTFSRNIEVSNSTVAPPQIPRHYSHIRIAQLAYNGNPLGEFERQLLRDSVDLVVPFTGYLNTIDQVSPATPQLIYTNTSNIYQSLLTDWLAYADRNRLSRESAFYHVSEATPWVGASPSSQPVSWFWNVSRGTTYLTELAHGSTGFNLGGLGQSTNLGFTDPFREINLNISTGVNSFYRYTVEYVSAVDSAGNPTAWRPLTILSNSTNGLRNSGSLTFDPPADWKTSVLSGSTARLYYVRIRNTSFANGPVVRSILGRDYAGGGTGSSGVIPAFDSAADRDRDGYLNDAEYATRTSGKNARFVYESRLFYPYYGPMRFITNPAATEFQNWTVDYHTRLLQATPLADGLFVDNSSGVLPLEGAVPLESTAAYASNLGVLLGRLNQQIAPKWILINTAGGGNDTNQIIRQVPGSMEEFLLRPLASSWMRFDDVASLVQSRLTANPSAYLILDSLPTGGSPTDPRTQIATLAYYYLLGNPETTFLMFNGGFAPASTWTQHWSPAAAYDVGQSKGNYRLFASGSDPSNLALTYKIMARDYSNALVLYKPLSTAAGQSNGTLANNTATTHLLNGNYRRLNADGTLSGIVTSVTLRNGEGAILIRA